MEDEHSFYIFLFLPWKKMFSVKISFVVHGRQAFFLHFLASSADDEHSFLILLSSPVDDKRSFFVLLSSEPSDECSFLFSANPMLQRHSFSCFFSMGLISNAYRVEAARTSSSWKSASHAAGQDRVEAAHALHARTLQDNGSEFAERLHAGCTG